jgi:hypothetical protein
MLLRSVDFTPNEDSVLVLGQHLCIRNCFQHNDGYLDADELGSLCIGSEAKTLDRVVAIIDQDRRLGVRLPVSCDNI